MFNVRKTAQAAAWSLRRARDHMPHLTLIRLMYLTDRADKTSAACLIELIFICRRA